VEVPIVGFGGQATYPLRTKRLSMRVRDKESLRTVEINFIVVDIPMGYNVILERPTLIAIKVVVAPLPLAYLVRIG